MEIRRDHRARDVVRVNSDAAGPRVVFFAGVHGDEVSGLHAIEKLFFDFFTETRKLLSGTVVMARCNETAIAAERRYITHNLNRLFRSDYGSIDTSSYEFRRAQELKPLLQDCDYFLDLHSAPVAREPFIVAEADSVSFFAQLGIPRMMTGWSKFSSGTTGGDAENYAKSFGAKSATLESGSHFDKRSNEVAYQAALSMLAVLDMIEQPRPAAPSLEVFDIYSVVNKGFDDFQYAGAPENFRRFGKGEAFAFQNGQPLTVEEESFLLIPMVPADTKIGEEVCYLARRSTTP